MKVKHINSCFCDLRIHNFKMAEKAMCLTVQGEIVFINRVIRKINTKIKRLIKND